MARRGGGYGGGQSYLDFHTRTNLKDLIEELRTFDKKLATEFRRSLRQVGSEAIAEMRDILDQPPPGVVTGHVLARNRGATGRGQLRWRRVGVITQESFFPRSRGSRAATAAGIATAVSTPKSGRHTVRITAPGDPFSKSYNSMSWRHPVRFNPATTTKNEVPWHEQAGRPYFGKVIADRYKEIYAEVDAAIQKAIDQVEASRSSMSEL